MKSMRILIAEDEIPQQDNLISMLKIYSPRIVIAGIASNGNDALKLVETLKPDAVFLDIQMPGMTGLEVARKISGQAMLVFITAYDQYAVKAFENEALDYLLKPVTAERLQKTIERLEKHVHQSATAPELFVRIERVLKVLENSTPMEYLKLIKVKTGTQINFIPISKVIFFLASDKYTLVQTAEKEYLITTPIKELENQLDPGSFWRVHRNAIVNVVKIDRVQRSFTNQMLIGFNHIKERIKVSRRYESLFK